MRIAWESFKSLTDHQCGILSVLNTQFSIPYNIYLLKIDMRNLSFLSFTSSHASTQVLLSPGDDECEPDC